VVRNFAESHVSRHEIAELVQSESAALIERRTSENKYQLEQFQKLKRDIEEWEKAHGLKIYSYGSLNYEAKEIGKTVRMLLNLRDSPAEQLKKAADALAAASQALAALEVNA